MPKIAYGRGLRPMPIQALLSAFLAAIAVGGFGLAFVYPLLSGERQAEKRQAAFSASTGKQPEKQTDGVGAA